MNDRVLEGGLPGSIDGGVRSWGQAAGAVPAMVGNARGSSMTGWWWNFLVPGPDGERAETRECPVVGQERAKLGCIDPTSPTTSDTKRKKAPRPLFGSARPARSVTA